MSPGTDHKPVSRHRTFRRLVLCGVCFALLATVSWVWWATSRVNSAGRIPQPNLALRFPGGLLQTTGMRDGLHLLAMRDRINRAVALQLERATYLGIAGYHRGRVTNWRGFTVACLTKTSIDGDSVLSPYVAIVLPYPVAVGLLACVSAWSTGVVGWCVRLVAGRRQRGAG